MANTYTQIHLQFVFAPKSRASLIQSEWEVELYKYITGIVQNNKHKMLCINGMPDHVHMLIGFHTTQSIADFMQDIKANSSKWINEKKLTRSRFEWQSWIWRIFLFEITGFECDSLYSKSKSASSKENLSRRI
jgi:putative transposase